MTACVILIKWQNHLILCRHGVVSTYCLMLLFLIVLPRFVVEFVFLEAGRLHQS